MALLQENSVPQADWPAVMALAYVTAGMIVMERVEEPGAGESAKQALLAMVDEVRRSIQEWTPDVDVQTQLAARFSGRISKGSRATNR